MIRERIHLEPEVAAGRQWKEVGIARVSADFVGGHGSDDRCGYAFDF